MTFSIERSIRALPIALLLSAAACGDPNASTMNGVILAGSGAGSPAAGGGAGASTISGAAGTAGNRGVAPNGMAGVGVGSGGAGAGAGGAPAAGSSADAGSGGMAGAAGAAGGASGAGGMGGAGGAGGATGPKPKCKTSPSQVIVIGDSYINWVTHTFPDDLTREAGEMWRMYAVGGCSLGSGGLCLIPDQLDQAIAENPNIIAGVMTGGGNDILIADELMFPGGTECKDRTDSASVPACQEIVSTAIEAGEELMQTAADAGIRDVIYMFYPHIPGGGFGGMNPNYLLDYALPKARALCEQSQERTQGKLRCHFIDLVPIFEGHPDWFDADGIHENSMGSAAMAKEVVRVAKEKCIAQPASSGCCEP